MSIIGILSDTHDNLDAVREAVRVFREAGCRLVIHAGDFVAPFAARELENLGCSLRAVFGNCDGEKEGLRRVIEPFGRIEEEPFSFEWESKRFLLTHVHFSVGTYAASGANDVVIYGHTHKPEVKMRSECLLINPGEAGGWLSGRKTAALLDTEKWTAEIIPL